jgi:hypothetical protein
MTDTFRLLLGTILCLFRARRSLLLENLAFRRKRPNLDVLTKSVSS